MSLQAVGRDLLDGVDLLGVVGRRLLGVDVLDFFSLIRGKLPVCVVELAFRALPECVSFPHVDGGRLALLLLGRVDVVFGLLAERLGFLLVDLHFLWRKLSFVSGGQEQRAVVRGQVSQVDGLADGVAKVEEAAGCRDGLVDLPFPLLLDLPELGRRLCFYFNISPLAAHIHASIFRPS